MQKRENQFEIHETLRNNKEKKKIKVNILQNNPSIYRNTATSPIHFDLTEQEDKQLNASLPSIQIFNCFLLPFEKGRDNKVAENI